MSENKANISNLPVIAIQSQSTNWIFYLIILIIIVIIIFLVWHYITKKMEVIV